jgi:glucose/arabinose dehydrogenase
VDPADVALPEGYRVNAVATGLTFPTAVVFDEAGGTYILEAGYSYGKVGDVPRLLRLNADGGTTENARGENPPWTGASYYGGAIYVAEGGSIVRITPEGQMTPLAEGLPSHDDHHTNRPVVGPDGYVYFGQGTAR